MERHVVLHLDMDAFFAAIEQRERPELRGQPVLIGRPGPRGVVATCSYEARPFGVHSAMPSVTAERLCPQGIWVQPRFELYAEVSRRIFELVAGAAPVVEQVSIDEAYADLAGIAPDLEAGARLAQELKRSIRQQESLTASAGVAWCRFLAKVASDMNKPDGLTVIAPEDVPRLLWPRPARVIPGVGPKLAARLERMGIRTVGELAATPAPRLRRALGTALADYLAERARGEDDTPVAEHHGRKQVSEERTYREDLTARAEVERELLARAEGVAEELRRRGLLARCIGIKVRDGRYRTITRSRTVEAPTDLAGEIYAVALALLRGVDEFRARGIRLLGLAARELVAAHEVPPSLFPDEQRARARAVARTADELRERFGHDAVRPARLLGRRRPADPAEGED
ncbi:MAG: DNA polymerase IV [Acidobacteria bacterium]|nr:DNA polymerase IV [Acidobacteriota bacterium]